MVASHCLYKNIPCAQHEKFTEVLSKFLLAEQFTNIIEIGTANGGLSLFLKDTLPNARVVTYDIVQTPFYQQLIDGGVEIMVKNVFSPEHVQITDLDLINHITIESEKLLVMVDGGNKIKEFACISKYIRSGQYLMTHDYIQNEDIFHRDYRGKIWDWIEITEKDIMPSCMKHGLVPVRASEMNSIVWQCVTKV